MLIFGGDGGSYCFNHISPGTRVRQEYMCQKGVSSASSTRYELYGVINHHGNVGGGHYTANAVPWSGSEKGLGNPRFLEKGKDTQNMGGNVLWTTLVQGQKLTIKNSGWLVASRNQGRTEESRSGLQHIRSLPSLSQRENPFESWNWFKEELAKHKGTLTLGLKFHLNCAFSGTVSQRNHCIHRYKSPGLSMGIDPIVRWISSS